MVQRFEIMAGALFIGVGLAGMPLEPRGIALSLTIAVVLAFTGQRFIGAIAMPATIGMGWLQHGQLRVALLAAGVLVGIFARFAESRPRMATALAAAGAVAGTAVLLFG
ncbi:MAG: hypothetical protein ABI282_03870 [Candidatus Baltobacteraceae bacterium]